MIKIYNFIPLGNVLPMFKLFYGSSHSPAKLINLYGLVYRGYCRNVEIVYYVLKPRAFCDGWISFSNRFHWVSLTMCSISIHSQFKLYFSLIFFNVYILPFWCWLFNIYKLCIYWVVFFFLIFFKFFICVCYYTFTFVCRSWVLLWCVFSGK